MTIYILYHTHKGKNARHIIKRADDKPPCACMWQELKRGENLIELINEKLELERDANK